MARSIKNQIKAGQELAHIWMFDEDDERTDPFKIHDFSSYRISGFKAFGKDSGEIPIRPLTIVFGPNSSGKSSLIHSLLYLNEIARTDDLDVYKPWIADGMVDLGGWIQFHNENRTYNGMDFNIKFSRPGRPTKGILKEKVETYSVEFRIMIMDSINSIADLGTDYEFRINDKSILRVMGSKKTGYEGYTDHLDHDDWQTWKQIYETNYKTTTNIEYNGDDLWNCPIQKFQEDTIEKLNWYVPTSIDPYCFGSSMDKFNKVPYSLSKFTRYISKRISKLLASIEYHGPFRDYRTRESQTLNTSLGSKRSGSDNFEDPLEILFLKPKIRKMVNKWLSNCKAFETEYEIVRRKYLRVDQIIDKLIPLMQNLSSEENNVKMNHIYQNYTLENAEKNGLWDDPGLVEIARKVLLMLEALSLATSGKSPEPSEALAKILTIELLDSTEIRGFDQVVLVDKISQRDVSFRDVGVGLSQVLPLVVSVFAGKNKLILMEQPELHIHPALQAELADVFINSSVGENGNTLILETHSEHLLLRILRRIRETSQGKLPEACQALHPEDVSVLYVEKGEEGSKVTPIPLTEEGDFAVPWPKGFFPERAEELFGL